MSQRAKASALAERVTQAADLARDSGQLDRAADLYAQAIGLQPERNDIRVQLGNMLKDSGRLAEAEAAYRGALDVARPLADTYLQLARTQRAAGKGSDAIRSYVRALEIEPGLAVALIELAHLGGVMEMRDATGDLGSRLITGVLDMAADLRRGIAAIEAGLPVLQSFAAVPLERYDLFRLVYKVPPAPSSPRRIGIVMLGDAPLAGILVVLDALQRQSHAQFEVSMPQLTAAGAEAFARLAVAQPSRFRALAGPQLEGSASASDVASFVAALGDHDVTLVAREPMALEPEALGWIADAFEKPDILAAIPDEDSLEYCDDIPFYHSPVLQGTFDREVAEQGLDASTIIAARRFDLIDALGRVPGDAPFRTGSVLLALGPEVLPHVIGHTLASRAKPGGVAGAAPSAVRSELDHDAASIAVVVPTRDSVDLVRSAVKTLKETVSAVDLLSIIIVDNGSNDAATLAYLAEGQNAGAFSVLRIDEPFNWSRLNNLAAASTQANLLVFMNNDVDMVAAGWDQHLRALLGRPEVGVVGARLVYPDRTIQHAGIALGFGTASEHDGRGYPLDEPGPGGRFQTRHSVSAVTGAFLATRRDTFIALGGFDEMRLPLWFNDVDYCLKASQARLRVLYEPAILAVHHASKTLTGTFNTEQRDTHFLAARRVMFERWGDRMRSDPWFSQRYAKVGGLRGIAR